MSQKKLNHAHVLARLVSDSSFTNSEAAEVMGLSKRQVIRLKGEYKKLGIDALVHKNIGKSPSHAFSEELRHEIINLKNSKIFQKANFCHFRDILSREKYNIHISYSSLHSILTSAGIKSPKTRRAAKQHRRRKRKAREGIMLQMDASPFDWINDGLEYSIHGAIDDATGKVGALYMCKNECLQGYFEVMRSLINENGIPISVYADRHAIFVSRKEGKLTIEEQLEGVSVNDTQFGRAIKELGITLIKAKSPQAKGRIERLWETLQSRLPIEFSMAGITTVDAANAFLATYIIEYNAQFAEEAEESEIAYRDLSPAINLDNVLCNIEKRTFDNGGVFSYYNKTYIIVSDKTDRVLPHRGNINVLVSPVFGVRARFAGIVYDVKPFTKPEKAEKKTSTKQKRKFIPEDSHYYKYGHTLINKVTYEDSDIAILKMLEKVFLCKTPA